MQATRSSVPAGTCNITASPALSRTACNLLAKLYFGRIPDCQYGAPSMFSQRRSPSAPKLASLASSTSVARQAVPPDNSIVSTKQLASRTHHWQSFAAPAALAATEPRDHPEGKHAARFVASLGQTSMACSARSFCLSGRSPGTACPLTPCGITESTSMARRTSSSVTDFPDSEDGQWRRPSRLKAP